MEFSLTDGKGKKFQFPVNPEEVTISRQKGFDTTTILSYGEFDFPQGEKVKEISFSSFFRKNTIQRIAHTKISLIRRRP